MSGTEGYRAAHEASAFIDRSDRVRVEFTGAQAAATLNGLLTNDVTKLAPGTGQYAAALMNKGKIIADVRVFARADSYLVDTSASAGPALLAMLKKYVNPRLAKFRDVSSELATIGVFGPKAADVVFDDAAASDGSGASGLAAAAHYSSIARTIDTGFIARVPDLGVAGFDLFVPVAARETIVAALKAKGATVLDDDTAHVLRVEAGRPLFGDDMDENTLAQEATLDAPHLNAISFDKGCYTGQETVARVHFRGHVNRTLRGLRCSSPAMTGATIGFGDNANAGDVRSVAVSPRFGPMALAYVRGEVVDGAEVMVHWALGETRATVSPLPFA